MIIKITSNLSFSGSFVSRVRGNEISRVMNVDLEAFSPLEEDEREIAI